MGSINLTHPLSGLVKFVPTGFSFTTLLFDLFVPLLRGDLKWALIHLLLSSISFGLAWLVIPFFYNSSYIKELLEKGYIPKDNFSREEIQNRYNIYTWKELELPF
ncbi:MAG: HrgC protein [Vampirovibrionales bacterium]